MSDEQKPTSLSTASPRLPRADRRRQLLDTALMIVREEGADRLTLGRLAERAGVSKPVAYDHFTTRSGLLVELYKMLDTEKSNTLRSTLTAGRPTPRQAVNALASAYISCSVDTGGEYFAVGAALAGSREMSAVHQELLDGYVQLFATVLEPHSTLPRVELKRRCVGFVGAGEALSTAMVRGLTTEEQAADTLSSVIVGALAAPRP